MHVGKINHHKEQQSHGKTNHHKEYPVVRDEIVTDATPAFLLIILPFSEGRIASNSYVSFMGW